MRAKIAPKTAPRMLPNPPLTRALLNTDVGRLSDQAEHFSMALGAALEGDGSRAADHGRCRIADRDDLHARRGVAALVRGGGRPRERDRQSHKDK